MITGSLAAGVQSATGAVSAGSTFAVLQSAAVSTNFVLLIHVADWNRWEVTVRPPSQQQLEAPPSLQRRWALRLARGATRERKMYTPHVKGTFFFH
jgi:hypothetical protein